MLFGEHVSFCAFVCVCGFICGSCVLFVDEVHMIDIECFLVCMYLSRVCAYMCVCVRVYVCACVCACECPSIIDTDARIHTCAYISCAACLCQCMYVCMYVSVLQ